MKSLWITIKKRRLLAVVREVALKRGSDDQVSVGPRETVKRVKRVLKVFFSSPLLLGEKGTFYTYGKGGTNPRR